MTAIKSGESVGTVEVTPSGIPVYYQSQPKRLYRLRDTLTQADYTVLDWLLAEAQAEDTDWREIPSVTTVLSVLDKPALPYWGNKVGVDGVLELVRRGKLVWVD